MLRQLPARESSRGAGFALIALVLTMAACGGGSSDGVFGSPGSQDSATPGGDTETEPGAAPTTTIEPEYEDAFDFIAQWEPSGTPPQPTTSIGSPDLVTAAAIVAELAAGDVDLTGLELWVFDVAGSDDRLLVVEAGAAAAGFGEDPEGGDLIEALAASPTTQAAGLTRLVINYYDADDEGDFALTMTLPMELLLGEVDEEVDMSQFLDIQVVRTDSSATAAPPTVTTTATPAPLPTGGSLIEDSFDESTTVSPLFGSGVMTSTINSAGQLEMTALTAGVIPSMYPLVLPSAVEIIFDLNPQPLDPGASFGALVLSEDPSDGALDHYVGVFAFHADSRLIIIPWNAAAGGWGSDLSVAIPPEAGFGPNQFHTMRLVLMDGQIDVLVNNVFVTTWNGPTPVTSGYWGPVIVAASSGDAMLVDNVLVEESG